MSKSGPLSIEPLMPEMERRREKQMKKFTEDDTAPLKRIFAGWKKAARKIIP